MRHDSILAKPTGLAALLLITAATIALFNYLDTPPSGMYLILFPTSLATLLSVILNVQRIKRQSAPPPQEEQYPDDSGRQAK